MPQNDHTLPRHTPRMRPPATVTTLLIGAPYEVSPGTVNHNRVCQPPDRRPPQQGTRSGTRRRRISRKGERGYCCSVVSVDCRDTGRLGLRTLLVRGGLIACIFALVTLPASGGASGTPTPTTL